MHWNKRKLQIAVLCIQGAAAGATLIYTVGHIFRWW